MGETRPAKKFVITVLGVIDEDELDVLVPTGPITFDVFGERGDVYTITGELIKAEVVLTEGV